MVVYLTEQGAVLNISGERIVLNKQGRPIAVFLSKDIDQIVIMGNIGITTQAMRFLLKRKIDTVFTSYSGKYEGRLVSELGKNVILRRLQFDAVSDDPFRFKIAKNIVFGKCTNSLVCLRKLNYYHKSQDVVQILHSLTSMMANFGNISNYEELLGFEGSFSNTYFSAFDHILKGEIKFEKRTRRPPQNEFNALLSFGYTILMNLVRTMVNTVGLDPYFGVLHAEDYGRPSLVLDMMEEFRSVAVDIPAINSVNKGVITRADFVKNENDDPDELPIQLSIFGRKKWISVLEKRFNSLFWYQYKNKNLPLREIIRMQTYLISKSFIDRVEYTPFRLEV